ncbi:hypothetical protein ABEB36_000229 [Hypothenemus hampei]|uniref:Transposable element P transposase-like RNase H C-terminal domain-containing protein n=1 Tax=Hypothenemus hampei TaxID=57062 RepID=A0ABD1FAN2_HYPHA
MLDSTGISHRRRGYNNNPTAKQFKSAFKKVIIHSEIKESDTASNVFENLKQHINDQSFHSNHINNLLKLIIQMYAKIRLTHHIKKQNDKFSTRHKYIKLILFQGQ